MIELSQVSKRFGKTLSLDTVSLNFEKNDKIALMGPNGAGKTTLIRLILGLYHPDQGTVLIENMNPAKKREQVLNKISFVPQLPPPIRLNVNELIKYASVSAGIKEDTIQEYADKMQLSLKPLLKRPFFNLSGGMKQKLLIAISLARESKIMIFDEPTANLDFKAREAFYSLLEKNKREKLLLFVTHREDELKNIINREIYMDLAKVISDEKI